MDTLWWIALGAVVLLALVAAYVDGTGRLRRGRGGGPRPRPGELWWAVGAPPHGEARLWLVLARDPRAARTVRVTGPKENPPSGAIPLPLDAHRPHHVAPDTVRRLPYADLRDRAGTVPPALWSRVQHLAD